MAILQSSLDLIGWNSFPEIKDFSDKLSLITLLTRHYRLISQKYYYSHYCSLVIFLDLDELVASQNYSHKIRGHVIFILILGLTSLVEL